MEKKYVTVSRWGCGYYMLDKNLNIVDTCYIDNGEDVTEVLKNRAARLGYEIKEAYKK